MKHGLQHTATNFYFDRVQNIEAVKILPGEYHVTDKDMLIVTVLGSCVAACIRDPLYGISGMNHFMLPEGPGNDGIASASARYGSFAMELLINQLLKLGARRGALEAKVFGGGNVLRALSACNVADRNAAFVLQYLKTENIPVVAQDLGGTLPRKVYQFAKTGRVRVKRLAETRNDTIFERERSYRSQIIAEPAGEVELFG
ncbi:MAG: cheD [Betaproteobacteria bacterium]|nr:cheD [Betaproteobacteria bacterium]